MICAASLLPPCVEWSGSQEPSCLQLRPKHAVCFSLATPLWLMHIKCNKGCRCGCQNACRKKVSSRFSWHLFVWVVIPGTPVFFTWRSCGNSAPTIFLSSDQSTVSCLSSYSSSMVAESENLIKIRTAPKKPIRQPTWGCYSSRKGLRKFCLQLKKADGFSKDPSGASLRCIHAFR